ncbi:MAG: 4'-phosphopantetheinyl transferase superfamily protein [Deltaproteobacteria bacterium]|nr:4'-phosphopantetheinyl transferase superfamily protein [Deltaproteobacteria bacterium]
MDGGDLWRAGALWPGLAVGAIDLWLAAVGRSEADWRLLSPDELERARRLLIEDKRTQFVSARAALRRILARALGRDPAALRFACGEQGKPELIDGDGVCFNLSHSHRVALIAVAGGARVGVDVELEAGDCALDEIAGQYFAEEERRALRSLPPGARPALFWRIWTLKEAYLKARGSGLAADARRCAIGFAQSGAPCLVASDVAVEETARSPTGDGERRWNLIDLEPAPGYAAAVCWEGAPRRIRRWREGAHP